jgi:asparagine N-glycosylation enzyme membrane subunit Stt3
VYLFQRPDTIEVYKNTFLDAFIPFFYVQHYFVILFGALSGYVFRRKKEVMIVFLLVLGYIGFSNMYLTLPRFGFMMIPLFCILSGYGIVASIEHFTKKQRY